jgi:hypothetical protein
VEPGRDAPERFALVARPEGLVTRAGASLDPDAELGCSVDTCTRLVAGDPKAVVEVEITGDRGLASNLLSLLAAPARDGAAVAA